MSGTRITDNTPMAVTRSRLPDRDDFYRLLDGIFERGWLTNNGLCVRNLERELGLFLGTEPPLACVNGTVALMLALHVAGLDGKKVALTPYTYVATLSALLWQGCRPVFVDVNPATLCLDPAKLDEAFEREPDIAGVLPVHIYGMACDVEKIGEICSRRGAVCLYDGAQAFASWLHGRSLLDYGDLSICSFHATKLFHSAEGGCVLGAKYHEALTRARAFGHVGDTHYTLGINAKMSELNAAMGLAMLPGTQREVEMRKNAHAAYDALLDGLPLQRPELLTGQDWNHAYYPVLFPSGKLREKALGALLARGIQPRRYFYPSLNTLPYLEAGLRRPCPAAEDAAGRVLCLPLYGEMPEADIRLVSDVVRGAFSA